MGVDLNNYDIHDKNTGAIRIRIPRTVFVPMLMALSNCIEKYIAGINSIALTCDFWRIDDELDELNQGRESAENLRKQIYDKLNLFLQTMEDENVYGACPGLFMHEPTVPDLEDISWACGSEKLIADIIQTSLDWDEPELTDWVQELKRGEHKF